MATLYRSAINLWPAHVPFVDLKTGKLTPTAQDAMERLGTVFGVSGTVLASAVTFTSVGSLGADNVQEALEELDDEKAPYSDLRSTDQLGYSTGTGGTVSQATSKATGVTLNKQMGDITMDAAALNAATTVSFTLTNSKIAATDVLVIEHVSGGTLGAYRAQASCAVGSATVYVRNLTAGNLSEAIVLRFLLLKGVLS
jgi:hypothetical protein